MSDPDDDTTQAAEIAPPTMSVTIANALQTRAPLTREQIECAIAHYRGVEALLRVSGPWFTNCRRDAAKWHNMAIDALAELEAREAGQPTLPRRQHLEA